MANSINETVLQLDLPGIRKLKSGKVREVFDLGDRLLFVATTASRRSIASCPTASRAKARCSRKSRISGSRRPNRSSRTTCSPAPANGSSGLPVCQPFDDQLARRCMIVKKAKPLAIECVVRGYLAGSGWKEYQRSQTVCGIKLPPGLKESSRIAGADFHAGHQGRNRPRRKYSVRGSGENCGRGHRGKARAKSLKIYNFARDYARKRGIIIADTKFEFGLFEGKLILIDEVLTPDSSRFWPADQYQPGRGQPSFDKQFVRDYLETLDWNKTPPGPVLPPEVVAKTSAKYLEAYERLTGRKL